MTKHSFDIDHAIKFGIESAVILSNIEHWIRKNEANRKHFHEGVYWTYNSVTAWTELFPYMTKSVIRKRLDILVEKGILLRGEFNTDKRDRTSWYAINNRQMDLSGETNALASTDNSSINTDSKHTDSKHYESKDSFPKEPLLNQEETIIEETEKEKQKKNGAKKVSDPMYPEFVRVWSEAYPELGFDAVSGVKIKSLIKKTKARLAIGGKEQTVEAAVAAFEYVIAYVKRDHHWCDGKDISTFDQKYLSIIMEIKNGKSTRTQSVRERINSL